MTDYRANYANGQVGPTRHTLREAVEDAFSAVNPYNTLCWVERYEAGSADEPGAWVKCIDYEQSVNLY